MILATSFWEYVNDQSDRLLGLMVEHAQIVLVSVVIAVVIGVGLGLMTYRTERPATPSSPLPASS